MIFKSKSTLRLVLGATRSFNTSSRSYASHYDVLGITPKATQNDIKSAYYRLSKVYHPDKSNEFHKSIASTCHFQLGRPKFKPVDLPTKEYVRVQVKSENPHMRIYNILEWAVLLNEGKPSICE